MNMLINITNVKREEMKSVDLSDRIIYSAIVNGDKIVRYSTDGVFRKHLTKSEWIDYLKKVYQKFGE